jgi:RNase H-fold protein (predicted Holliday junction resolvase)
VRAPTVDFGRKKTGVAVSAGGLAPRPVAVLRVPGHTPELIEALITLALKEDAQARAQAQHARR